MSDSSPIENLPGCTLSVEDDPHSFLNILTVTATIEREDGSKCVATVPRYDNSNPDYDSHKAATEAVGEAFRNGEFIKP